MDLHDDWWQLDSLICLIFFFIYIYTQRVSSDYISDASLSKLFPSGLCLLIVNVCLFLHPENTTDFILY